MSDLVILYGIKYLLNNNDFPFEAYTVEYGNENKNEHDIMAEKDGVKLSGEAFNVATSFFQGKKTSMLNKLRKNNPSPDYVVILVNSDAVDKDYALNTKKLRKNEYVVFIDIENGEGVVNSFAK